MNFFEEYPDISISANIVDKNYKITYTRVIEDFGKFSFERKQKIIPKENLEKLIQNIINETTHTS